MLPTKLQVLKLHLFFRDEAGKKNQNVSKGEITAKVMKVLKFFLTANIGADAAITDLTLYKKLKKFSKVDKELADEALATRSRHLIPGSNHCPVLPRK